MARNRMIKPEFWADAKVGRLSLGARLLFIGMWNFADDYGTISASPRKLLGEAFENDESVTIDDVRTWLAEIETQGMIIRYTAKDKDWYEIPHFLAHQKGFHKSDRRNPENPAHATEQDACNSEKDACDLHATCMPKEKEKGKEKEKDKEKGNGPTMLSSNPQRAIAIEHLKNILLKYDPEYAGELDKDPYPPEISELIKIAMREGPMMVGKLKGWEAAEKALEWLKQDDFMRQYASVWWLFDVKNGGKKARYNLIEYSGKKPGAKNVKSNLGDGQPFPSGHTFG